jgi:putative FmdB family regulatory protein
MPKYAYKCDDCLETFEVIHGMNEEQELCCFCKSINLHRVPQMLSKAVKKTSKGKKVGDEVKRAIEENRALLKEEKKKRVELPDGD